MAKKKPLLRSITAEEIELFVSVLPELSWDDFAETAPGQWDPRPESYDRIQAAREVAVQKLAEIEAKQAQAEADLEAKRRQVAETWFPAQFLPMNEKWIDKDAQE